MPKRQGFATLPKAKHKELSSLGGSRKVPKGYASLSKTKRVQNGKRAAQIRWDRVRMEREFEGKPINS